MTVLENIRDNITDESAAYGYTLSVWGSGALLLQKASLTPELIMAFVTGGVIGFGVLAFVSFKSLFEPVDVEDVDHVAASIIHVLASFTTVLITYLAATRFQVTEPVAALLGVHVTVTYNLMLVLEELISKDIYQLENR